MKWPVLSPQSISVIRINTLNLKEKPKAQEKRLRWFFHVEGIENPQAPENGVILVFLKVNMVEKWLACSMSYNIFLWFQVISRTRSPRWTCWTRCWASWQEFSWSTTRFAGRTSNRFPITGTSIFLSLQGWRAGFGQKNGSGALYLKRRQISKSL